MMNGDISTRNWILTRKRAKVPSQELSDYLVQGLLDKKKEIIEKEKPY